MLFTALLTCLIQRYGDNDETKTTVAKYVEEDPRILNTRWCAINLAIMTWWNEIEADFYATFLLHSLYSIFSATSKDLKN